MAATLHEYEQLCRRLEKAPDRQARGKQLFELIKPGSDLFRGKAKGVLAFLISLRVPVLTTLARVEQLSSFGNDFTAALVDEAAQASEVDTNALMNAHPQISRLVLSGDPKQNSPVVKAESARERGLAKTLFERLRDHHFPLIQLNIQYRMHPSIARVPLTRFYDQVIADGAPQLPKVPGLPWVRYESESESPADFHRVAVIDVGKEDYPEEKDGEGSTCNPKLARLVLDTADLFARAHVASDVSGERKRETLRIGIITMYRAQEQKLRRLFEGEGGNRNYNDLQSSAVDVFIGTVDEFQGQQRDLILLDTVRTELRLGFVDEHSRFNVAATRAVRGLVGFVSRAVVEDSARTIRPTEGKGAEVWRHWIAEHEKYSAVWKAADLRRHLDSSRQSVSTETQSRSRSTEITSRTCRPMLPQVHRIYMVDGSSVLQSCCPSSEAQGVAHQSLCVRNMGLVLSALQADAAEDRKFHRVEVWLPSKLQRNEEWRELFLLRISADREGVPHVPPSVQWTSESSELTRAANLVCGAETSGHHAEIHVISNDSIDTLQQHGPRFHDVVQVRGWEVGSAGVCRLKPHQQPLPRPQVYNDTSSAPASPPRTADGLTRKMERKPNRDAGTFLSAKALKLDVVTGDAGEMSVSDVLAKFARESEKNFMLRLVKRDLPRQPVTVQQYDTVEWQGKAGTNKINVLHVRSGHRLTLCEDTDIMNARELRQAIAKAKAARDDDEI
ncbi:unnamed protein product [Amoebophrya sp. A120]|nr:unnamed protein product [Amoebophrya sp. A120]